METKPTKPGWYYAGETGLVRIVRRDGELRIAINPRAGLPTDPLDKVDFEIHEEIPTFAELQQLRAERDTLKKQVEFLEWMANAKNKNRISWVTLPCKIQGKHNPAEATHDMVTTVYSGPEIPVANWPGELRDGWPHLDKIKEAVK